MPPRASPTGSARCGCRPKGRRWRAPQRQRRRCAARRGENSHHVSGRRLRTPFGPRRRLASGHNREDCRGFRFSWSGRASKTCGTTASGRPASSLMRAALVGESRLRLAMRVAGPKLVGEGINIPYAIPNTCASSTSRKIRAIPTGYLALGRSVAERLRHRRLHRRAGATRAAKIRSLSADVARLRPASPGRARSWPPNGAAGANRLPGRSRASRSIMRMAAGARRSRKIAVIDDAVVVHRVTCAVDCGTIVNPDTVGAQIEGAIAFGLERRPEGRDHD